MAFEKKGLDEDIINLRFKHYQNRLIDILNRVLEERRKIKHEMLREEARLHSQPGGAGVTNGKGFSPMVERNTFGKTGAMMLSPMNNQNSLNRTTVGGFSFLTQMPNSEGELVDLLDLEQKKA